MPKKTARKSTKQIRRVKGRGAYYPGGMTLRGRGGFIEDVGSFFKKAAGPLLGVAGGVANTIWPGSGMVADGIRKLIGAGAYTPVRSNAILAQPVPRVNSTQDTGITYSHQEYLGDVTGSTDWELTQFHVNPGLPETFPWLSGVAANFQKYRIDGLVFYLRSTSSVAIANTENLGLGTVMGGFQTNVYDKAPSSKLEFLSLSGARSGKPSEDHIYPMECDRSKNVFGNLLVRTVGVADDLQKYDHAVFNLATVGFPGAYYLGELWVSYKLTLIAPKVESTGTAVTTLPIATTDEKGNITGYTERLFDAERSELENGIWMCHPPVTDQTAMYNTLGWTIGKAADAAPCIVIPPGSSGYYLFEFRSKSTATGQMLSPEPIVLDHSGACQQDNSVICGNVTSGTSDSGTKLNVASRLVWKLETLPDKPMLLRYREVIDDIKDGQFRLDVFKLPEKMFAANSLGTTVSLAQKVQRVQRRYNASGFAPTAQQSVFQVTEPIARPLTALDVAPPTLTRQTLNRGKA